MCSSLGHEDKEFQSSALKVARFAELSESVTYVRSCNILLLWDNNSEIFVAYDILGSR